MGLDCDTTNIKNLFKDGAEGKNTQKVCQTKVQKSFDEKKNKIKLEKTKLITQIENERNKEAALKAQEAQLQAELDAKEEGAKTALQEQLTLLKEQLTAEQKKLSENQRLMDQEKEFASLQGQETTMKAEEDKKGSMPDNIDKILESGTLLEPFRQALRIERVIKDKMYIGNYGGFYGEKMRVDLVTFLKDLRTGMTTKAMIRENYKTMHNLIYDFDKRELYFVKPGEKISENLGNLVKANNHIVIFIGDKRLSAKELAERKNGISKMNDSKLKEIGAEIDRKKKMLEGKVIKDSEKDDPDIIRLETLRAKINEDKEIGLSDWSYLRQGKEELFTSTFPEGKDLSDIIDNYGIIPTPYKLSSGLVLGKDLYTAESLSKYSGAKKNELLERPYIPHQQLIEISGKDDTKYEYCIATFQTGFSFNSEEKKSLMGMDYISKILDEDDIESNQMPILNQGESYSDIIEYGSKIVNTIVENEFQPPEEYKMAPAPPEPIIKYFSPKQGLQGSIVKVVGLDLDKIEYFCFRDVKAVIIQKSQTFIEEGGNKVVYDQYLIKVPTLRELGKECWQSLRPYETLVWGYYKGMGKQIRTSEVEGVTDSNKIKEILMFRYMDRTSCPDGDKLEIPK